MKFKELEEITNRYKQEVNPSHFLFHLHFMCVVVFFVFFYLNVLVIPYKWFVMTSLVDLLKSDISTTKNTRAHCSVMMGRVYFKHFKNRHDELITLCCTSYKRLSVVEEL